VKFVEFLLDSIESPPTNDEADAVPDVFVKLLLAFNLHFEHPSDNLVMSAVAGRGTAKTFTEKLMLLFNREGRFMFVSADSCSSSRLVITLYIYLEPISHNKQSLEQLFLASN